MTIRRIRSLLIARNNRVILWGVALFLACTDPKSTQRTPRPTLLSARAWIEHKQGRQWRFDTERRPLIRIDHSITKVRLTWLHDGNTLPLEFKESHFESFHFLRVITVPPLGEGRLLLESSESRWDWPAVWATAPSERQKLAAAIRARKAGRYDDALQLLKAPMSPGDQIWAQLERARLAYRMDNPREAVDWGVKSARSAWEAGLKLEAATRYRIAAYYARNARWLDESKALLDQALKISYALGDPEGIAHVNRYLGMLEQDLNRYPHAEARLTAALSGLLEVGHTRGASVALTHLAALYNSMGRHQDGLDLLSQLPAASRMGEWQQMINVAFIEWEAVQACALQVPGSTITDLVSLVLAEMPTGQGVKTQANIWINLGAAALSAHDLPLASEAFEHAERIDPTGGIEPLFFELHRARLALALGELDQAETYFWQIRTRALQETGSLRNDMDWRALHGLGQVALRRSGVTQALGYWHDGLTTLEALAQTVGLQGSRSTFFADRRDLLASTLRALLGQKKWGDAFRVADAQSMPALQQLMASVRINQLNPQQLQRWTQYVESYQDVQAQFVAQKAACHRSALSIQNECQANLEVLKTQISSHFNTAYQWLNTIAPITLAPVLNDLSTLLKSDEALLAVLPLRATDSCVVEWHSFLLTADRIQYHPSAADPVAHWVPEFSKFEHLYVIDGGSSVARSLPSRPIGNGVWGGTLGISYLPQAAWLQRKIPPLSNRTLVVADPKNDLPHARKTGTALDATDVLIGDAAQHRSVLDRLDGLRWLHFDGHGDLAQGDPWTAHLRLADAPLTVSDLLTRRPQMGLVVLAGCETGKSQALSRTEQMGLAEAFLLAGAEVVLAADRVLPDEEASRFIEHFYAEGGVERPAKALKATIATLHAAGDPAWRGWRLFGRRAISPASQEKVMLRSLTR